MRMRRFAGVGLALALGVMSLMGGTGCASTLSSNVESQASLGRVVIYRNGIAYFERAAEVHGDTLELSVPADKVDDFLKSLTVVDADTKKPAPVSYPTTPPGSNTGIVQMKIQLQDPGTAAKPKKLLLTYVTEAPSWKPSYRIMLGEGGKVDLEAWAIVDNTSGEDWKNVQLGVGSSSALSFRFDLHSVRTVAREMLAPTDLFAQAPPTGMPVYGNGTTTPGTFAMFDDSGLEEVERATLAMRDKDGEAGDEKTLHSGTKKKPERPKPATKATGSGAGRGVIDLAEPPAPATGQVQSRAEQEVQSIARRVQSESRKVVVEGFAKKEDSDRAGAALGRANRLREQLIANGVAPDQIEAVANMEVTTEKGGARIMDARQTAAPAVPTGGEASVNNGQLEPIGVSHFESKSLMTVNRGTSAMVSILKTDTKGEVVYLYDAESVRGNDTFAFRAVRLSNPTDSTLETGPVTVFGQGRFIGEGLTDPIPGKSVSFIPFALDRQVVVEEAGESSDKIARIITAQRGILSTEMRHSKTKKLTITNKLGEPASVYIRHTVPKNFKLSKHPEDVERIGEAYLFRVDIPANGKTEVVIEEETPVFKTVDIRSQGGMELVRAFVSSAALEGDVAGKLKSLLSLQKDLGNIEERIATQREQMGEYRARMDELHAQLVTLKAVKTAGPLMKNLEEKLSEVSDKVSKATVDLVSLEEQRMIQRIKLQDGVAELSLENREEKVASK